MKKLFVLLWISILLLTGVCCVMLYKDDRDKEADAGNTDSAVLNPTYSGSMQAPTLPIVTTPQPVSRSSPDNAGSRLGTDFEEPSGSGSVMTEEQAADNAGRTDGAEGETLEQYEFADEMYPYRAMLTSEQQIVYDDIYAAAVARTSRCPVREMISSSGLDDIMTALYNDNPELFFLDTQYSYGYSESGRVLEVVLKFNETSNNFNDTRSRFNQAASSIINEAKKLGTDEEKEKYVYDAIMDRTEYDASAPLNQSAYSALVNNRSVCAGYSRAFQYIMKELDIPCYFCSGYAKGGAHAWNIVKINGEYYNVDISWDDSLGLINGEYTYQYFNVKDDEFSVDHTRRDLSVKLPKCE